MHPAKSVILFTTMSGAGYGLLVFTILGQIFGCFTLSPLLFIVLHGTAFVLISSGLLSSTFHLGRPERAWRALSQWRTSWLSREGVLALATYGPWTLFVYAQLMMSGAELEAILFYAGLLTAVLALSTVYTTSMIYRSIKAVPSWYNKYVSPVYLVFGLTTGVILISFVFNIIGQGSEELNRYAIFGLILSMVLKGRYWRFIDNQDISSTLESATGLGFLGKVKAHDAPHSHDNYLLQEMGFKIARNHSKKLRRIFKLSWSLAALSMVLLTYEEVTPLLVSVVSLTALVAMIIGVMSERWLFFAEAKHVQSLYYGH